LANTDQGLLVASQGQLEVSVEKTEGLRRSITVRVPSADIDREIEVRLKQVGKTARLKGFRPGKVPASVVRKRFGGQVRQEVVGDIIRSSFSHAVAEKRLNPAGGPAIEPLAVPDGAYFAYRATFEVYPEVTLGDISSLEFEVPEVEIADSDVDRMILRLRKQRGHWEPVERAAAEGDRVTVDFIGRIDGETFEGSEGKGVKLVLGSGQVIADFEQALLGLAAGAVKTADVTFPGDYKSVDLAGRRATFEITVGRVDALVLPEVDAEFMQAFGNTSGDLETFRTEVRRNMQRELDERLRVTTKNNVLEALHSAHAIELPRAPVEQEIHVLQHEAMRRMGIPDHDHDRHPSSEPFRPVAEKRVRLSLLVQELIVREKIALDRSRVERRIQELAAPYEKPAEAAQLYRSNADLMTQIESSVLEDQVVDHLVERGKAGSKRIGFDEFMQMHDAG
jgi:trigger factor